METHSIGQPQPVFKLPLKLRQWHRRVHERTELARMPDSQLQDIGITRADAIAELQKPFWRR